eukprot:gene7042-8188_t
MADGLLRPYRLMITTDVELIGKVVAILRNAILTPPNDVLLAAHPTVITSLIEILHSYFTFKTNLTDIGTLASKQTHIGGNTPRYILEILSKIAKRLPLRESSTAGAMAPDTTTPVVSMASSPNTPGDTTPPIPSPVHNYEGAEMGPLLFSFRPHYVLRSIPLGISRKVLETLEMATHIYDNDDALLACIETLEQTTRTKSLRANIDETLMKPLYEPLFDTHIVLAPADTTTTPQLQSSSVSSPPNSETGEASSSTNITTPTMPVASSPIVTIQLKQSPVSFGTKRTIIERLIELLGHNKNDIQQLSLNVLFNLLKLSKKTSIMICHCSGLVRHLCNLLSYKPGDHMMEMGKKAAQFLSYISKEPLNLCVFVPFEPMLAQIALTDNPHTDIITNILIKLETTKQQ